MSMTINVLGGVCALTLLGLCACSPGGSTSVPVDQSSAPALSGAPAASSTTSASGAQPQSSSAPPASSGYDRWPQRRHAHSSTDGERG